MKWLILLGILFLPIIPLGHSANLVIDSYTPTGSLSTFTLNNDYEGTTLTCTSGRVCAVVQQFGTSGPGTLVYASFYLKRTGIAPSGTMFAILYTSSGVFGSDTVPVTPSLTRSATLPLSDLTTSFQTITFTFTTRSIDGFFWIGVANANTTNWGAGNGINAQVGNVPGHPGQNGGYGCSGVGESSCSWATTQTFDFQFSVETTGIDRSLRDSAFYVAMMTGFLGIVAVLSDFGFVGPKKNGQKPVALKIGLGLVIASTILFVVSGLF